MLTFVSLDGVMQAPGGSNEDVEGKFPYGGWTFPYFDEVMGRVMGEQMSRPFDLLLGRRTYELFASYWPNQDAEKNPGAVVLNRAKKYVVSNGNPDLTWDKSELITDEVVVKLKALKKEDGPDLQVHGSANLIQTLLKNDLVDELWLKIFPVTLGTGKRLFAGGTIPAAFTLLDCTTSPSGVIIANYKRAGEIKTGSFA